MTRVDLARVAELVDARDLKSLGTWFCTGSIPVPGTNKEVGLIELTFFFLTTK